MRPCTKNYLESILRIYPEYDVMIKRREESVLHPDEVYIDQNTAGIRSSIVGQPTENKVMAIVSDDELNIIKIHKAAIEETLEESDFFTNGVIEAHYFVGTKIEIIAQELGTTPDLCNKVRKRFLEKLSIQLKLLK